MRIRTSALLLGVMALCSAVAGGSSSAWAATPAPTYLGDAGRFAAAEISPVDAEQDSVTGEWYIFDAGLACVRVYAADRRTALRTFFTCGGIGNDLTHVGRVRGIGFDAVRRVLWLADTPNHRVLRLDVVSGAVTVITGTASPRGAFLSPGDVATDPAGNAYVVDRRHRVVILAPDGAYSSEWGMAGKGPGQLNLPMAITFSSVGANSMYITNARNYRVDRFALDGTLLGTFGKGGKRDGQFTTDSRGVAVDADGVVYAADTGGNRIVRWKPDGTALPSLGRGVLYQSGPQDIFFGARGIAIAGNTLVVTDMWNDRVLLWSLSGEYVDQIGLARAPLDGHVQPAGVAVDAAGNIYVSDYWNQWIQKFAPDGTFIARWGIGRGAATGTLNFAGGIEVDDDHGLLYIANREQHVIDAWRLTDGSFVKRMLVPSVVSAAGVSQAFPRDVAVDPSDGSLFVADDANRVVVHLSSTGVVLGRISTFGASAAPLGFTASVALDEGGGIWIADQTAKAIHGYDHQGVWLRSIPLTTSPAGIAVRQGNVYVMSGANVLVYSTTLGVKTATWPLGLFRPYVGIAVDATHVVVADGGNHRVKIYAKP
jgi:sugar lactone lactonase YvrE